MSKLKESWAHRPITKEERDMSWHFYQLGAKWLASSILEEASKDTDFEGYMESLAALIQELIDDETR